MKAALVRLRDLIAREPVVVRSAIGLLVALGLIWGVDLADVGDRLAQTVDLIAALVALLGVAWGRQGSAPMRDVVEVVAKDGTVVAGPASRLADGTPIAGMSDHDTLHLARVHDTLPEEDPGRPVLESVLEQARHLSG